MNLDIKELELKLRKYEPSNEWFNATVPSDPYLIYRKVKSIFMTKELNAIQYINDLSKYIDKANIKPGVQDTIFNQDLVKRLAKLLDTFPEFQNTEMSIKDMNLAEIAKTYAIDMSDYASRVGLSILLTIWFVMPFIGLPALVPLVAIWSDKKDKLSTDDLETTLDVIIEHLVFAYNKSFDKNLEYNPKSYQVTLNTIYNAYDKLIADKDITNAAKAKKTFKLGTAEKLLYINAVRRRMSSFKAFVGSKPSKNIDIAKKLSKTLNMASIEKLGESFNWKLAKVVDIIGLLDKLQDIIYDCIINLSKDMFKIMA